MPTKSGDSDQEKIAQGPARVGLTAAGREHFKETEGANLKPGVKGAADTPEKMKRKGSFLRSHFANPNPGPMKDEKGKPTRRALSAQAWGEPVPVDAGRREETRRRRARSFWRKYPRGGRQEADEVGQESPSRLAPSQGPNARAAKPAVKAPAKTKKP